MNGSGRRFTEDGFMWFITPFDEGWMWSVTYPGTQQGQGGLCDTEEQAAAAAQASIEKKRGEALAGITERDLLAQILDRLPSFDLIERLERPARGDVRHYLLQLLSVPVPPLLQEAMLDAIKLLNDAPANMGHIMTRLEELP